MARRVLVFCGNPVSGSLCEHFTHAYADAARGAGHECRTMLVSELRFDPNLRYGYHQRLELEPDLVAAQEAIRWAEHLVFVYPTWWGSLPALMKGFIDRTFLPEFAFRYRKNSVFWDRLLAGRTARLIVTMDAPWWWDTIINGATSRHTMAAPVLKFSGVRPVRQTVFDQVRKASPEKRERWTQKVRRLGAAAG
ncbi:MAG: NAD(P)H-dependent oxidoreductase [Phycisphaerales bacterium]